MNQTQSIASEPILNHSDRISTPSHLKWGILRRMLGLVLISAGVLKGYELATLPLLGNGLFNQRWLLVCLVQLEATLGAWLLLGRARRTTWGITLVLWFAFVAIAVNEAISGADSCGCFGLLRVNPWYTASFDVVAVLALLLCRPRRTTPPSLSPRALWERGVVAIIALIAGVFGIWNLQHYSQSRISEEGLVFADGTVVLEPEKWIGKPFILGNYIDVGSKLMLGRWIVLLFRYDCDHCQHALPRYIALASPPTAETPSTSIALIEMPPFATDSKTRADGKTRVLWGQLSQSRDWFASTPIVLELQNGNVVAERTGASAEEPNSSFFGR